MCVLSAVLLSAAIDVPVALATTDYYVQSISAKIMAQPSFKSTVIEQVPRGTKLESSGREGTWIRVRYKNKDGYISSLVVTGQPPLSKVGVIKGDDAEIKRGVRKRASANSSAAAARGLVEDEKK